MKSDMSLSRLIRAVDMAHLIGEHKDAADINFTSKNNVAICYQQTLMYIIMKKEDLSTLFFISQKHFIQEEKYRCRGDDDPGYPADFVGISRTVYACPLEYRWAGMEMR